MTSPSPAYLTAATHLRNTIARVVSHLDGEPAAKAARDENEPGRRNKNRADAALAEAVAAYLAWYQSTILETGGVVPANPDPALVNKIATILSDGAMGGIELFTLNASFDIDYTLANAEAAQWAQTYAYDLIRGINEVSQQALQDTLTAFVNTPGYTIKDVVDRLSPIFGETRAANIATTEITRAYAQGNQIAGEALKKQWPEVRVIKRWYTNRDSRVCPICGPMHNQVVDIDAKFTSSEGEFFNPPAHPNCRCWTVTTSKTT